jgi:hypothetical protein
VGFATTPPPCLSRAAVTHAPQHDHMGEVDCGLYSPLVADPSGNHRATDTLDSVSILFHLLHFSIHIDTNHSYNDNHNQRPGGRHSQHKSPFLCGTPGTLLRIATTQGISWQKARLAMRARVCISNCYSLREEGYTTVPAHNASHSGKDSARISEHRRPRNYAVLMLCSRVVVYLLL